MMLAGLDHDECRKHSESNPDDFTVGLIPNLAGIRSLINRPRDLRRTRRPCGPWCVSIRVPQPQLTFIYPLFVHEGTSNDRSARCRACRWDLDGWWRRWGRAWDLGIAAWCILRRWPDMASKARTVLSLVNEGPGSDAPRAYSPAQAGSSPRPRWLGHGPTCGPPTPNSADAAHDARVGLMSLTGFRALKRRNRLPALPSGGGTRPAPVAKYS